MGNLFHPVCVVCPLGNSTDFALAQSPAHAGGIKGVDVLMYRNFHSRARFPNAPHYFGLLGGQSLQYPPPSLRDTSASGGHGNGTAYIYYQSNDFISYTSLQRLESKIKRDFLRKLLITV